MASLIRVGITRLTCPVSAKSLLSTKNDVNLLRTITSKAVRSQEIDRPPKPAPWPYQKKRYNRWHAFFDRTTARLDENSKIIVVEGPVAAGKSKFAQELAEELDMLYLPEANLDMVYINKYGFDLRTLDEQLPPSARSFDIKNFLLSPKHENVAAFQIKQYQVKYSQYIDALAHVLSTGQGVVLDRCCYSDFVFAEAMYAKNYLSKAAYRTYYEFRDNTIGELLRPHLIIYLDVNVPKVMDNIKKRARPSEKNSPVLSRDYLAVMDKMYKQQYLKQMSDHAELLIYDWSEGGETEIVVEDIERINFGSFDDQETKMKDWYYKLEEDWAVLRNKYADRKNIIMAYFNVPAFHVPELCMEPEDAKQYHDVMNNAPGERYAYGYNADLGDSGFLFKLWEPHRETLPIRERRSF